MSLKKLAKTGGQASRGRAHGPAQSVVLPKSAVKVLKTLVDAITDDDAEEVVQVWRRAMKAQRRQWNINTRDWDYEDDVRTQLEATKLVAAYKEGLPVQRQVVFTAKFEDMSETLGKLKSAGSSPAIDLPD